MVDFSWTYGLITLISLTFNKNHHFMVSQRDNRMEWKPFLYTKLHHITDDWKILFFFYFKIILRCVCNRSLFILMTMIIIHSTISIFNLNFNGYFRQKWILFIFEIAYSWFLKDIQILLQSIQCSCEAMIGLRLFYYFGWTHKLSTSPTVEWPTIRVYAYHRHKSLVYHLVIVL